MTSEATPRARLQVTNLSNQETVYQRCLLATGTCHDYSDSEDFVAVRARDGFGQPTAQQNWPVAKGAFKCLLMLQPGPNQVDFELYHRGNPCGSNRVTVQYQPLLQLPPLHLAIMVAKDSPLLMDCPPAKRGAISSAHSSLDAAIAKLRMTAYMWQALTAEDFRLKGLGRRSFRLEEEWGLDTTTASSLQCDPNTAKAGPVAKVHVVRSEKTVAELRDASIAQQNHRTRNRNALYTEFEQALAAYGSPFDSLSRPVVAGLILDSHYSIQQSLILAHAALGSHTNGLSLGVFGSHTTYAWPRFLEEVPSCLLDPTPTGDAVANDHGKASTMQGACAVGQQGLLYQVGRTFGADERVASLSRSWKDAFLAQSQGETLVPGAGWDLRHGLSFMTKDHFKLPGDKQLTPAQKESDVLIRCVIDEKDQACLEASCLAGLARIRFEDKGWEIVKEVDFCRKEAHELDGTINMGPSKFFIGTEELQKELDRSKVIAVEVLSMHGKMQRLGNLWSLLAEVPFLKIPGTSLVISKRSVKSMQSENDDANIGFWHWALLLKRKHRDGGSRLTYANKIDLRIGGTMDGAIVYYQDGTRCNCGKARQNNFGGHQSEERQLTESEAFDIAKVSINSGRPHSWGSLDGCQMTLSDGESWGAINNDGSNHGVQDLVCSFDERIIGFYGRSDVGSGYTHEFGIITAPKSVVDSEEGLPREIYDMPELQNIDGGLGPNGHQASDHHSSSDEGEEEDESDASDTSMDEDED